MAGLDKAWEHEVGGGQLDAYGYLRSIGGLQHYGGGLQVESRISESWAAFGSVEAGIVQDEIDRDLEFEALVGLSARW